MKHPRIVLLVLPAALAWMLASPPSTQAQSLFLERGQNAVGADAGFAFNDNASFLTAGGGYALAGWIDFNLRLHRVFSRDGMDNSLGAIAVQPGITAHVLKQDARMPVSVTVGATFQYAYFDTPSPDTKTSQWGFVGNAGAYRQFTASPTLRIIPQALLFINHSRFTITDNGLGVQPGDTTSETIFGSSFLCHFALNTGRGPLWTLSPALTIDKYNATFGMFFGAIFR